MIKLEINDEYLDLGASPSTTNVTNYVKGKNLRICANLSPKNGNYLTIDLEIYPNNLNRKFKNIFLMNVMEHIKNNDNCIKNISDLLEKKGNLYGSTPFLFKVHRSPNDYLRYTHQFLDEFFTSYGFENIHIKNLGTGIFCCFYGMIFDFTKKIPFLNLILFPIFAFLDKIINLISVNSIKNYPLGYFFSIKKN